MFEREIDEYKRAVRDWNQELTVFILTYNRERYLKLALESIICQTYSNFALVVLDNYSTDGTEDLVKSIDDDRIIYIKRISDFQTSDTNMRFAFSICVTNYLIVFHDDDTIEPTFIEEGLKEIKSIECSALSVGGKIIDENGKYTGRIFNHYVKEKRIFKGNDFFNFFFGHNADSMLYPSVIYKREFFEDYKKYITVMDVGPCNDQYLWFQIGRYGGSICIDNLNLMNYRVHKKQDSSGNAGFMEIELLNALYKIDYYSDLLFKMGNKINLWIYGRYIVVYRNYIRGTISKEKLSSFFNYDCVKKMKNSKYGRNLYGLMNMMLKKQYFGKAYICLDDFRHKLKGV